MVEPLEAVVQSCSVKKVFLKILQNSQENSVLESLLNKFTGLKRLHHMCFSMIFAKLFRTPYIKTLMQ